MDATFESMGKPGRPPTESFLDLILFGKIKIERDSELNRKLKILKFAAIIGIIIIAIVVIGLLRDYIISRGVSEVDMGTIDEQIANYEANR
jgi:hypothetical protein